MARSTDREREPGALSQAISAHEQNQAFQGDPLTGKTADISGILNEPLDDEPALGGHPAESSESTSDTEGGSSGDSQFTYASHEEAERVAEEAQQGIARLGFEINETRDLLYNTLARQAPEQGARESPTDPPAVEHPVEFNKRRRREVLDEIEALDWDDDDDYKEKVADAQAKADADILKHYQGVRDADERWKREQREDVQAVIDQAGTAMKDAGLDALPESEDSILFWALTQVAPREKDGVPLSVDEQIQWTINKTKTYKTQALETYKAEGTAEDTEEGHVTLSSVVGAVAESRRM